MSRRSAGGIKAPSPQWANQANSFVTVSLSLTSANILIMSPLVTGRRVSPAPNGYRSTKRLRRCVNMGGEISQRDRRTVLPATHLSEGIEIEQTQRIRMRYLGYDVIRQMIHTFKQSLVRMPARPSPNADNHIHSIRYRRRCSQGSQVRNYHR